MKRSRGSRVFLRHASCGWLAILVLLAVAGPRQGGAQEPVGDRLRVEDRSDHILASMPRYSVRIEKAGFRYAILRPDGREYAPAHRTSGLQIAESGDSLADAAETRLLGSSYNSIRLRTTTTGGPAAIVSITFAEDDLRFSVRPEQEGRYDIVLRTGGMSPAYGLADHVAGVVMPASGDARGEGLQQTRIVEYRNEHLRADRGARSGVRMVSNFVIYPRQEVALVNVHPEIKIVRVTAEEAAQGSRGVRELPALYYFVGEPEAIYRSFLDARNRSGFPVDEPKYDFFGVGWEAWGALAWDTNERTVRDNVEKYLELGYPLRWMVVGSGFWPRSDSSLHATTSFGLWDPELYPNPRGLIDHFHRRGLKFIIGLRIAFITDGPFAAEGVRGGYFISENGRAKIFEIGFPRKPVYLLDATAPGAVDWYVGLVEKWLDYGVDGFKEDLFGYGKYDLRDDKVDPIHQVLMQRGVMIMGRNAYLGSPADIHRYEDFNFNQNQDRGPINGLAFAYSGFPYVYPDVVGGTLATSHHGLGEAAAEFSEDAKARYLMRYAQYASVNPAMGLGYGPWNFSDERVHQVVLEAARLHDRLHPYIYSAAIDAHRTGFPYPMTPLPLAYPRDPHVYELENSRRRGYQWRIGESLLATPLYGEDYATAETRDVYLPAGEWIDYDTGERYQGGRTLEDFPLPVGKTPLFVGGKGIVVERREGVVEAHVYPLRRQTSMQFHHPGGGESTLILDVASWEDPVRVRTSTGEAVQVRRERGRIIFPLRPATDYLVQSAP